MKWIITFTILCVFSCASGPNYEEEHATYLRKVHDARENMSKVDFGLWLKSQLKAKENEFEAFGGLMQREDRMLGNHEQRSARAQEQNDVYEHQKDVSHIQLRRYSTQRKYLEKQIFLLKGLLSQYDSPFVP